MCADACPCSVEFVEQDNDEVTVVCVYVEVERNKEDGGYTIDRYPRTMGYAHFLGELIVYDLDGNDVARYGDDEYESIMSWNVLEDGTQV